MSSPPSCSIASATKARKESPSPASTALPHTVPRPASCSMAALTPSASLAQIATDAPSSSSVSAIARPRPLVAPVTMARLPVSPRSMGPPSTADGRLLLVLHSRNPRAETEPEHTAMTTESITEFRRRARAWLEQQAPRRTAEAPLAWGEGEFSVVVFHDASDEEELDLLTRYREWHTRKVAAGFGAIAVPSEFGGLGLSRVHDSAYKEVEAEFDVPRDHEVISVTSKLVAPTIDEYGTPEQRHHWCRRFFQIEELCCQLFSEPGAGSDLAGLACRAVRDGDQWVLDGQKVWT